LEKVLEEILDEVKPLCREGNTASYIPALSLADRDNLGLSMADIDGKTWQAGDSKIYFTMQSIAKIFCFSLALKDIGLDSISKIVGLEPTGHPFYSLEHVESTQWYPHNPFTNAGAITICSMIKGKSYKTKFNRILTLIRDFTVDLNITMDEEVYISEKNSNCRNKAITYLVNSFGLLQGSPSSVLDLYTRICAIKISTEGLAIAAATLANNGVNPKTGKQVIASEHCTIINALMSTCGLYDESGVFAINVGFPAKSGVGGGILSVVPGCFGIGVYGPSLNKNGNSIAGIKALELLSKKLNLSLYQGRPQVIDF